MKSSEKYFFCGIPGIGLEEFLKLLKATKYIESWFWDAPLYFTHKGRIAIRKACQLINIQPGDEVLMPAYNCGTEIDPVIKGGATAVLYRVDRLGMVDIHDLQCRITRRTKAIYATHYFGFPQQIGQIKELCETHDLYLIEDCALSLFSKDGSKRLGTTGDISIFNLTKTLPVPDGGVLVINNIGLMKEPWEMNPPNQLSIFRAMFPLFKSRFIKWLSTGHNKQSSYLLALQKLGLRITSSQNQRCISEDTRPDMLPGMYYDDKLNNQCLSFISKLMLPLFDAKHIVTKRRENYNLMLSLFQLNNSIEPLFKKLPPGVCPLHFPVLVKDRDEVAMKLCSKGINSRPWWRGYHRQLPWKDFPESCFLKNRLLTLPIHQELSPDGIAYIASNFMKLV